MARKVYDVVATVGKYEKNGETKYVNKSIGSVLQTDKGLKMIIAASFNPAGCPRDESGGVWLALFEPRDDQQQQPNQQQRPQQNQQAAPPQVEDWDDIPFTKHHSINGV